MIKSIYLCCPKCYESYEIQLGIYDSFAMLECSHCQHLDVKSNFKKTEKFKESEKLENKKVNDNNCKEENEPTTTKTQDATAIPLEKIMLTHPNNNPSSEILKNLLFMVCGLALISGFVFLMIRK